MDENLHLLGRGQALVAIARARRHVALLRQLLPDACEEWDAKSLGRLNEHIKLGEHEVRYLLFKQARLAGR